MTVWVGTFGAGVARLQNGSFTSYTKEDGLGHNQVMAMEVMRDGKKMSLNVTCALRTEEAESTDSGDGEAATKKGMLGLELSDLTDDVAERLGVKDTEGVVITSVQPGSPAALAGLSAGDVLVQINRKTVKSMADVESVLKDRDDDSSTLLLVKNERGSRFVVIKPAS